MRKGTIRRKKDNERNKKIVDNRKNYTETNNERNKEKRKGIINKIGYDKGKDIPICTSRRHKKKAEEYPHSFLTSAIDRCAYLPAPTNWSPRNTTQYTLHKGWVGTRTGESKYVPPLCSHSLTTLTTTPEEENARIEETKEEGGILSSVLVYLNSEHA
jgi:hypothetical protein